VPVRHLLVQAGEGERETWSGHKKGYRRETERDERGGRSLSTTQIFGTKSPRREKTKQKKKTAEEIEQLAIEFD
jgi:hypothetical protein